MRGLSLGKSGSTIYVVQHTHVDDELDFGRDIKFIGAFADEASATKAVASARVLPGFAELPGSFSVEIFTLDEPLR